MPVVDDNINLGSGEALYTGSLTPEAPALTFALADSAVAGAAAVSGSIVNTSSVPSGPWSIAAISGLTISPSSGSSIAAGATVSLSASASAAGTYNPTLTCAGATITNGTQSLVVTPAPTITLSKTGNPVAGTEFSITVTAANLTGPLPVTLQNVTGSATINPTTATPALGELSKLFGATWAAAGSVSVRAVDAATGLIVSNTLAMTVASAPTPPPPPPPSVAPTGGSPQVTLRSSSSGTLPFTFLFACRQGQFTAGIVASGGTTQVTVRNRWPDASAKLVELAGSYVSTGGVASTITLASGTASTGTALTTADLQAALTQPVTVDAGGFGSASWSGSDWASPFQTWTTGHLMSSWVYRKQVGSDAHLVAWL